MTEQTFVIAGGGLAGAKAAEGLREEGFDGRIVLIGAESELPYERPPLSKDYLRGEAERASALVHPGDFYEENGIELMLGTTVEALDAGAKHVVLDTGERHRFDTLLLATGSEPRRLPLEGSDLDGIHYLRTLADADALKAALADAHALVVIGGGFIGAEVAASARQLGLEVAIVEPAEVLLAQALGPEIGGFYTELHRDHGVEVLTGNAPTAFEGRGRVERVRLRDGRSIDADLVLVGVGAQPRVELAAEAGLLVENGIVVTSRLETSAPGIFAAGDVASAHHPFYRRRIRVEHWANALNQPEIAARAMLGKPASYDRLPYFYSDQYDVGMQFVGDTTVSDEVVLRGEPSVREFVAFWLSQGAVVAAMNVNVWDAVDDFTRLIRSRAPLTAADNVSDRAALSSVAEGH